MFPRLRILAAVLSVGMAASPVLAQSPSLTEAQRGEVEAIIRDYLLKNPDLIVEALHALEAREQAAAEQAQRVTLTRRQKDIFEDPKAPVLGNPKGDVTVVEFFDYACGYCKAVQNDVVRLLDQDAKVRLVMKEYPILGPGSLVAARAALASHMQGKYREFHAALMAHKGQFDMETVQRIAKSVGLDTEKLKADMEAPDIMAQIQANHALADDLNIRGTPGFVIGTEVIPGAIRLDEMKKRVAAMRGG